MDNSFDIRRKILEGSKSLIRNGKLEEALKEFSSIQVKDFDDTILVLNSKLYTAKSELIAGTITNEIYETKLNKIRLELLAMINQASIRTNNQNPRKTEKALHKNLVSLYLFLVFFCSCGIGIGIGIYQFVKPSYISSKNKIASIIEKPPPLANKTGIFVAPFQVDLEDGFSSSLIAALRDRLSDDNYMIGQANSSFGSVNQVNYRDSIAEKLFNNNRKGVFISGLWIKEEDVFNCYIDLFNFQLAIPTWQTPKTIILNNPTEINLSIQYGTDFLADLMYGIVQMHEGNAKEALDKLYQLDNNSIISQNETLAANLLFYQGHCHTLLGNHETAKKHYEKAKQLGSEKLNRLITKNIEITDSLIANVPDYVLKQILKSILTHKLAENQEAWFKTSCESLVKYLPKDSDSSSLRRTCGVLLTPLLYYKYRYRGDIIEVGDSIQLWQHEYDDVIATAVGFKIIEQNLKSGDLPADTISPQVIENVLEKYKEIDNVLRNKVSFPGRKIDKYNPKARVLRDITNNENAKAREELYQKRLKARKKN